MRIVRTCALAWLLGCALLAGGSGAAHATATVLVYGDSLSAAYGMPERRGWVALLEQRLQRERPDYSVANA
ncbi:MAG: hypothetical protein ACRD3R_11565, partial [Terriglobales bacterium]